MMLKPSCTSHTYKYQAIMLLKLLVIAGIYYSLSLTHGRFSDDSNQPTRLCPRDHFPVDTSEICRPFFTCGNHSLFTIKEELETGYVKRLFHADWNGMEMVYSIPRYNFTTEDFIHGVKMLSSFQHTRFVPQLIGFCTESGSIYLATKFYKYGSVDKLKNILDSLNLSPQKELHVRSTLALDYLEILAYLHNSPIGTRVMCDSNDLEKTLSQFLVTDELRLVVVDLDALPLVDHQEDILVKCGHRQLFGNFVAPEQLWPFENEVFDDSKMPGYDEKTDVWKVPNVLRFLLGQSNKAIQFRLNLLETFSACKEEDPSLRPDMRYLRDVFRMKMNDMNMLDTKNRVIVEL